MPSFARRQVRKRLYLQDVVQIYASLCKAMQRYHKASLWPANVPPTVSVGVPDNTFGNRDGRRDYGSRDGLPHYQRQLTRGPNKMFDISFTTL